MNDKQRATIDRTTAISTPTEREVVSERVFAASRERVFAAFTEPELIARWWGRTSTTTIVDQLDLRPGGGWRFVERNQDGSEQAFRGVYREVVPPELVVYTFEWEGEPGHVVVDTASFEDLGESTKITVSSLFHTGAERDGMLDAGMEIGMNEAYQSLDELLADNPS